VKGDELNYSHYKYTLEAVYYVITIKLSTKTTIYDSHYKF
jgi:hypothetical protein